MNAREWNRVEHQDPRERLLMLYGVWVKCLPHESSKRRLVERCIANCKAVIAEPERRARGRRAAAMNLEVWYRSERGHWLPVSNYIGCLPVLTVELCCKWYSLYLIDRGVVTAVDFSRLEKPAAVLGVSPFCDHVPNPACVRDLALAEGWHLDDLAEELIVGRWELEVLT